MPQFVSQSNSRNFVPAAQTALDAARDSRPAVLATLVGRVAEGDADALGALYDITNRLVFGAVLKLVWQREDAEEVTADVYTQVWRTARTYDASRGTVDAWLLVLARARAIDRLRARRARCESAMVPVEPAAHASGAPSADAILERARLARMLRRAINRLPHAERRAVALAFYGEHSHSELARSLDLPLGTVKTRVRNGLRRLRRDLVEASHAGDTERSGLANGG